MERCRKSELQRELERKMERCRKSELQRELERKMERCRKSERKQCGKEKILEKLTEPS